MNLSDMTTATLIQMSISGTVLIFFILLIRKILLYRISRHTFVLLWGITLIRLLIPFSVSYHVETPMISSDAEVLEKTLEPVLGNLLSLEQDAWPIDGGRTISWISVTYLLGVILCLTVAIGCYFVCLKKFRRSVPVSNPYLERWLKSHAQIRKIQFRQCAGIFAPLTYGVIKPVILVPETLDWEKPELLDKILLHEYFHIRRFDVLLKITAVIAACVHWFNPLVWIMFGIFNRDLELSCDEYVIQSMGYTNRAEYARALISIEERHGLPILGCSEFGGNIAEERIISVMKIKPSTVFSKCCALGLSILLGIGCMISVQAEASIQPPDNPAPTDTTIPATAQQVLIAEEIPEATTSRTEKWVWPVESKKISVPFGMQVPGQQEEYTDHICISAESGDSIASATNGTVVETGFDPVYGNYIVISDQNNLLLFYGHLADMVVSVHDSVLAGDIIGTVGQTGQATGPNLSFAVFVDGEAIDPLNDKEYK